MRHHLVLLAIAPALVLAACDREAHQETQTTVTKDGVTTTTITKRDVANGNVSGLNIDSDKFKANIEIPGLSFGGDHMDMDGMKLYPGSTVKGMRVHAVDRPGNKKGEVVMDFSSPAAPATVARHMADQARNAGFTLSANTAAMVSGTKPDDDDGTNTFTVTLNPNGDGTVGQMTMTGIKDKD